VNAKWVWPEGGLGWHSSFAVSSKTKISGTLKGLKSCSHLCLFQLL